MEKSEKFPSYSFTKIDVSQTESFWSRSKIWIKKSLLLFTTLLGVVSGVTIGLILRPYNLGSKSIILISYPGEIFMRILKLMILPLVSSSLITGSASLNAKMNGKIALRTMICFVLTSMFNAFMGVVLAVTIHPGDPQMKALTTSESFVDQNVNLFDSLLDLGRNLFPDNIFQATIQQAHTVYVQSESHISNISLSTNNTNYTTENLTRTLQYRSGINTVGIVFFCLTFGTVLGTTGKKGQVVIDFFGAVFEVIMKIVVAVMWFTPIGVASVIIGKIISVPDLDLIISQLGWFVATVAIGLWFYQFIVMQLIYFIFLGKNPYKYYCGLLPAALTAAAAASTAAALPVTFRCMHEKLNMDPRLTKFILPIGANINTDGAALFLAASSVFIAQMNNMILGYGELVTIFVTATIASMSGASIPSAALVTILLILSAIKAPVEDVTILFAIDWLLDRMRTMNNLLGDCYTVAIVQELSKNELSALENIPDFTIQNDTMKANNDVEGGLLNEKTKVEKCNKNQI